MNSAQIESVHDRFSRGSAEEIRAELRRVLSSRLFRSSERLSRFLEYIVENTVGGRTSQIKEYSIGVEVCGRGPDFDPRIDPIVRIDARRLRTRLREYYSSEGSRNPLRIELQAGSYVPSFDGIAQRPAAQPAARPASSVAVLPLESFGGGEDEEAIASGLTDGLISSLAHVPGLSVVARTSTFSFKGASRDAREIGDVLNVGAILEGSLQREGGTWRLRLRLVDTATGCLAWSGEFNARSGLSLDLQDEICRKVSERLGAVPWPQPRRQRAVISPEAYALYYKGRHRLLSLNPAGVAAAVEAFESAIDEAPRFALAYAGLANAKIWAGKYGEQYPRQAYLQARFAAEKALALDPAAADAWAALGAVRGMLDWDWPGADRDCFRAFDLDPSLADDMGWHATLLGLQGRTAEATGLLERAIATDPLSLALRSNSAVLAAWSGRAEDSIRLNHEILELEPRFYRAHWSLGIQLSRQGRLEEALEHYGAARAGVGDLPFLLGWQGHCLACAGRTGEARANLCQLERMRAERFTTAMAAGLIHLGCGDLDTAMASFEEAAEERTVWVLELKMSSHFAPLRGKRYDALLRRMRLG